MAEGLRDVQGRAPADGAPRHGRRRRGLRRLRAPSDRDCRDAGGRAIGVPAIGRIWAIFEPRSATSCRRVFQEISPGRSRDADRVMLPPVFRSTLPEDQRLSAEAARRRSESGAARTPATSRRSTRSCATVAREAARAGDLVVVMSNGGFDDIHQKLLTRSRREPHADAHGRPAIVAAGDAAWLIELPERIDPAVNARAIAMARRDRSRACAAGVRDVVVGYCTVMVVLRSAAARRGDGSRSGCTRSPSASGRRRRRPGALVEVPVCYGGEHGPDLADVARVRRTARRTKSSSCTARATYRVFMVGFVPGLRVHGGGRSANRARRAARRRGLRVPAGSVAIAGGQTGVYPAETPGGWNIIGRTPVKPFDADRARAVPVQGRAIASGSVASRGEFERSHERVDGGTRAVRWRR